jgi:hypothetical protein
MIFYLCDYPDILQPQMLLGQNIRRFIEHDLLPDTENLEVGLLVVLHCILSLSFVACRATHFWVTSVDRNLART